MSTPRRYEHDANAEREALRLRGAAGLLALISGAWLLLMPDLVARLFGIAGCAFGLIWLARWRRGAAPPSVTYLEVRDDALVRCEGAITDVVPWSDVNEIDVDEDRLLVRIERREGAPLRIEPRYGLGLYALADELRVAWRRAVDARTDSTVQRK